MNNTQYLIIVFGSAIGFMVFLPLTIYSEDTQLSFKCPTIDQKDSQSVKEWKQSCKHFEYDNWTPFLITCESLGCAIIVVGLLRIYLEDKTPKQSKYIGVKK